jgi:hypothetical protein
LGIGQTIGALGERRRFVRFCWYVAYNIYFSTKGKLQNSHGEGHELTFFCAKESPEQVFVVAGTKEDQYQRYYSAIGSGD